MSNNFKPGRGPGVPLSAFFSDPGSDDEVAQTGRWLWRVQTLPESVDAWTIIDLMSPGANSDIVGQVKVADADPPMLWAELQRMDDRSTSPPTCSFAKVLLQEETDHLELRVEAVRSEYAINAGNLRRHVPRALARMEQMVAGGRPPMRGPGVKPIKVFLTAH